MGTLHYPIANVFHLHRLFGHLVEVPLGMARSAPFCSISPGDLSASLTSEANGSGRGSTRQSVRQPPDAEAAHLPASVPLAGDECHCLDHPQIVLRCAGALSGEGCRGPLSGAHPGIDHRLVELAQSKPGAWDRADFPDLPGAARADVFVRIPANLLHAVDRTEGYVRPAQSDLPPPATDARGLLR